jgi:polysaccharide export outer membrane protein
MLAFSFTNDWSFGAERTSFADGAATTAVHDARAGPTSGSEPVPAPSPQTNLPVVDLSGRVSVAAVPTSEVRALEKSGHGADETRRAASVPRNDSGGVTNGTSSLLKPGLVLRIDVHVLGKKEVEEESRRVGERGEITLPLIGAVKATEYTIDQLAAELQTRYSRYYVNPQVVVEFVTDQRSGGAMPWGYITVLGRVKRPGRVFIPATRDLTVSAAIQEAGGFDTSARDTGIRLTRVGEDGKTLSQDVNLRAVGSKGELADDIVLRPGDVVYVPELVF